MIKEDFVSFELARLLKEKGFDGYCFMLYSKDGAIDNAMELYGEVSMCNGECSDDDIAAPTFQMAIKFLYGKGILVNVQPYTIIVGDEEKSFLSFCVYKIIKSEGKTVLNLINEDYIPELPIESYNECLDNAITYALNLI